MSIFDLFSSLASILGFGRYGTNDNGVFASCDRASEGPFADRMNGHTQKDEASEPFQLGNFSVDEYRPLKVVCIGAGISGIVAGIRCVTSSR